MASPSLPLENLQSEQMTPQGCCGTEDSSKPGWDALWAAEAKHNAKRISEDSVEIRRIYDSGISFFTKSDMRDMASQIKAINYKSNHERLCEAKTNVTIHQVNGKTRNKTVPVCPSVWFSRREAAQDGIDTAKPLEISYKYEIYYTSYQFMLLRGQFAPLTISTACESHEPDKVTNAIIAREPLPLEDVRETLAGVIEAWEAGACCKQLRASLQTAAWIPPVTKIIAFACGSVSHKTHDCSRSLKQHAFALTIRDVLESRRRSSGGAGGGEIRLCVQDPVYNEVDRAVLLEHGITVLDDPEGFLEVDDDSAVLSFSPNVPVKQIVADIARPAMIAWEAMVRQDGLRRRYIECLGQSTRADEVLGESEQYDAYSTDPYSPRVRKMISEGYDSVFESDEYGTDNAIYIRRRETTVPIVYP